MKTLIVVLLLLICTMIGFAGKVTELPDVMMPQSVVVDGDNLVISLNQDYRVHVYSLKDFKLKVKFAKKGEGPGEAKRPPLIFPTKDGYMLSTMGKVMWFSKEGNLIKEIRVNSRYWSVKPVESSYVAARFYFDSKTITHGMKFFLLDDKAESVKELYGAKKDAASAAEDGVFKEFKMLVHHLAAYTYEDKIFVADSRRGLFLDVFDKTGKHLYAIKPEIDEVKVTDTFKDNLISEYKQAEKELWPLMKNSMTWYKHFPLIRTCSIQDGRIYITTYHQKDGKHELIILDLKGNIIKRLFVPFKSWREVIYSSMQMDLFTIKNGKLYELVDNEEKEVYELHISDFAKYLNQ